MQESTKISLDLGWKRITILCVLVCVILGTTNAEGEDPATIKFIVLGDWGGVAWSPYTTQIQLDCARSMAKKAQREKIDFVMALGDNFYFHGVKNEYDKRFKQTFETVYWEESMQVPWLVLAGNHDHYGNVSGQIAYTKHSKRWYFPHYYYKKSYQVPGPDPNATLDIFMLDTEMYCGKTKEVDDDDQPLQAKKNTGMQSRQYRWLEKGLQESTAKYIIVAGHHQIYSASSYGTNKCLQSDLVPLFQKHRVNTYLCGHKHALAHLQPSMEEGWKVEYFVSGAANFANPVSERPSSLPKGSVKFAKGVGGYAFMEVSQDYMSLVFYDQKGQRLYKSRMVARY